MHRQKAIINILIGLLLAIGGSEAWGSDYVFRVLNASNGLADNSAQIVRCTRTGRMIIATLGNINFYDGASFTHVDVHPKYLYPLEDYHGNYHLYFDRVHHLWLKNTNTVTCVDLVVEKFIENVDSVFRTMGCKEHVRDFFVDSQGEVWLLTKAGLFGVDHQRTFQVQKGHNLQDVAVYNSTLLLFYDDGEEVGLNMTTGRVVHRTRPYEEEKGELYNLSSVLRPYHDGFYQIRNGHGRAILMFFDAKNLEWTTVKAENYHFNNMAIKDDKLFLASSYGYWTLDIKKERWEHYPLLDLQNGQKLETDVNAVEFDRQGGLWLGTEKRGLLYAKPSKSPFHPLTWDNPKALEYDAMLSGYQQQMFDYNGKKGNCKYTDSRGWTWYGTTTGLYLEKKAGEEPEYFTKRQGLANDVVHSIVEDHHHNIWVSTSFGITCFLFDGEKLTFVNSFNRNDDVPNESFINGKAICLDNGTIVMQGLDHVLEFHPDSIKVANNRKLVKLYPKLVRLLVNGNFVSPGEEVDGNIIIDRAASRVKDISLNSNQNSVSLTFSALNYFRPLQTFYRVRVKGLDDTWKVFSRNNGDGSVDNNGLLHLPLIGLKPGHYEVEVLASMFPDIWDESDVYAWEIHVNQPWWQKTGVLVILALILTALIAINFLFYSRNTKMRAQRASEEGDVIKKIRSFVERVNAYDEEMLAPDATDGYGDPNEENLILSPQFVELMQKIIPYVKQNQTRELTMRQLSLVSGKEITQLYETVIDNLHKKPRSMVMSMRLKKAADTLRNTDQTVEQVAKSAGFYSPNYFMGCFFHEFKMTPKEFRRKKA